MKWKKKAAIAGLLIVSALVILHSWISYHSAYLIKKIISSQSKGELAFLADHVTVSYFKGRVEFENSTLHSVSTNQFTNNYNIQCKKLVLQLKDIMPLITGRGFIIDSVIIESPHIELTKRKHADRQPVNIAFEWAAIYNSLVKAVDLFYISKLNIRNASFRMTEYENIARQPFEISEINLLINQLHASKGKNQHSVVSVQEIALTLGREQIILAGGKGEFSFKGFSANTATGLVMLDSCSVHSRSRDDKAEINIFTEAISVKQLDFARLYKTGDINASSIRFLRPRVTLSLQGDAANKDVRQKSLYEILAAFNTRFSVNELLVTGASGKIASLIEGRTNNLSITDANLYIKGLKAGESTEKQSLIGYDSIDVTIKNHQGTTADSSLIFDNGVLQFTNDQLFVEDLSLFPAGTNKGSIIKSIRVKKAAIKGVSVMDLLFDNILTASAITLSEPDISLIETHAALRKGNGRTLAALKAFLHVKSLFLSNGRLTYTANKGTSVNIKGFYSETSLAGLADSRDAVDIIRKVRVLGFTDGVFKLPAGLVHVQNVSLLPGAETIALKKAIVDLRDPDLTASLDNVKAVIKFRGSTTTFPEIKNVSWNKGSILLSAKTNATPKKSLSNRLKLLADKIAFQNTDVQINNGVQTILSFIKNAVISNLKIIPGEKMTAKDLVLLAYNTSLKDSMYDLSIGSLHVPDNKQFTSADIRLQWRGHNLDLNTRIPGLRAMADVNQVLSGDLKLGELSLYHPEFSFTVKNDITQSSPASRNPAIPLLDIQNLDIKNAYVNIISENTKHPFHLSVNDLSVPGKGSGDLGDSISLAASGSHFLLADSTWSFSCGELKSGFAILNLPTHNNDSIILEAGSIALKRLLIDNNNIKGLRPLISVNSTAAVDISGINMLLPVENVSIQRIWSEQLNKHIRLDSVKVQPVLSREAFIEKSPWQTDDIRFNAGRVNLEHWRIESFILDSVADFERVTVHEPTIDVYRDKNKPLQRGIIKPLPTAALQMIPFRFVVDSMNVNDGHVIYHEKSDKTKLTGRVEFTRMWASIKNIKNTRLQNTDTLRLKVVTSFMDKATAKVRIDESYRDSLSGFVIGAWLSPVPLDILNDITQPLASVQIKSGFADTVVMQAVAKDHVALGVMRLYYHDLKVKVLSKGVVDNTDFLGDIISFAANTFIVKHKNSSRRGLIYLPRLREQSIFNYLAKMFLLGTSSSIGAKSNRTYKRRYKRAISDMPVPQPRAFEE